MQFNKSHAYQSDTINRSKTRKLPHLPAGGHSQRPLGGCVNRRRYFLRISVNIFGASS